MADGKFRISDIHECGGYSNTNSAAAQALLKRSQSTGDIDDDDKNVDVPFIDSDHSCCHDKPPGVDVIKLFTSIIDKFRKKLEYVQAGIICGQGQEPTLERSAISCLAVRLLPCLPIIYKAE